MNKAFLLLLLLINLKTFSADLKCTITESHRNSGSGANIVLDVYDSSFSSAILKLEDINIKIIPLLSSLEDHGLTYNPSPITKYEVMGHNYGQAFLAQQSYDIKLSDLKPLQSLRDSLVNLLGSTKIEFRFYYQLIHGSDSPSMLPSAKEQEDLNCNSFNASASQCIHANSKKTIEEKLILISRHQNLRLATLTDVSAITISLLSKLGYKLILSAYGNFTDFEGYFWAPINDVSIGKANQENGISFCITNMGQVATSYRADFKENKTRVTFSKGCSRELLKYFSKTSFYIVFDNAVTIAEIEKQLEGAMDKYMLDLSYPTPKFNTITF